MSPAVQAKFLRSVAYPLALFLSGTLNLAAAEFWIRRTRKTILLATEVPARIQIADALAK